MRRPHSHVFAALCPLPAAPFLRRSSPLSTPRSSRLHRLPATRTASNSNPWTQLASCACRGSPQNALVHCIHRAYARQKPSRPRRSRFSEACNAPRASMHTCQDVCNIYYTALYTTATATEADRCLETATLPLTTRVSRIHFHQGAKHFKSRYNAPGRSTRIAPAIHNAQRHRNRISRPPLGAKSRPAVRVVSCIIIYQVRLQPAQPLERVRHTPANDPANLRKARCSGEQWAMSSVSANSRISVAHSHVADAAPPDNPWHA